MTTKATAFLALLIGLALLAGAGYLYSNTRHLVATASHADGAVVDFERRSSKSGHSSYPVIGFTTAAGESRRFTTSGAGDYAMGQRVDVLYDPQDTASARLNSFAELWFGSLALGAFGLLCIAAGLAGFWFGRARNPADRPRP